MLVETSKTDLYPEYVYPYKDKILLLLESLLDVMGPVKSAHYQVVDQPRKW